MQTTGFRILSLCLAMSALPGHDAAAEYVRKRVLPDYFIPAQELQPKQEKLPPIKYRYGEEETISSRSYDNLPTTRAVSAAAVDTPLPPQETMPPRQEAEKAAPGVKEESSLQPSAPLETAEKNVPEYQQKYQEYLRDIKKVSAGKKMPSNPRLTKDLAKMNSDERILVDQKFNAGRDVLGDFKNALSGH